MLSEAAYLLIVERVQRFLMGDASVYNDPATTLIDLVRLVADWRELQHPQEAENALWQWVRSQKAQGRKLVALIPPNEAPDGPRYAGYYCEDEPNTT
jgi:hypothetical protein